MVERLPDLTPLGGRLRTLEFHGDDGRGSAPYRVFMKNTRIISDPAGLSNEGEGHMGHRHLTFSNCIANVGDGPLLLAITKYSTTRAKVSQVVEDDSKPRGQWRRIPVGKAERDENPDHNHWHYSAFLEYRLRSVNSGAYVGRPKKQSFCLQDVAKLKANAPRRGFTSCPGVRASTGLMGISVGWGDVYWDGLQEQYVEVGRVPPGAYWLQCRVDPKKLLVEKSRGNNFTKVKIRIP